MCNSTTTFLCHHNFIDIDTFDGERFVITRKGSIRVRKGGLAIIPGSMGTRSYIVKGKGNTASFDSASHGAGRRMSRSKAKRQYTADDLAEQTRGVECRKSGVVDERLVTVAVAYINCRRTGISTDRVGIYYFVGAHARRRIVSTSRSRCSECAPRQ